MDFLKRMQGWMDLTKKIDFLGPLAIRIYLAPIFIMAGWGKLSNAERQPTFERRLPYSP